MIRASSVWELVLARAAAAPDATMAVDDNGRSMTFGEFRAWAERVAAGLASLGVDDASTVAWQLPTRFEAMVLMAALARLGAVQNPLLPILRHRELDFIARQTSPDLFVVPGVWHGFDYTALAEEVARSVPDLEVVMADPDLPKGDIARLPPFVPSDDVKWLYYTSGTTGEPKGVRHTDQSVMAGAYAMVVGPEANESDSVAIVFPVSHIGGAVWLLGGLMCGCRSLVIGTFEPDASIDFLDREGLTIGSGGTVFATIFLEAQRRDPSRKILQKVRVFLAGASPKPPTLHDDLKKEIGGEGLLSAYGMTEWPIGTCGRLGDPEKTMRTTEGRPSPGAEIVVGVGGELLVRGPQLFRGYVDPALDTGAFDGDGRFRTGDLGRVDDDGFVTITGRLKDLIIRKGENISAKEIEDLLFHHPKVADVAVIGLPDPKLGERCCAVVVPAEPFAFAEMVAYLKEQRLMVQKIPERLEIVDELPRNATGKVLKHELRDRFAAQSP